MILFRQPFIPAHGASPAFTTARGLVGVVNPLALAVEFILDLMLAHTG